MRSGLILPLLLSFASAGASAQQGDTGQPTLTVRSTLVEVPVLVKTKAGRWSSDSRRTTSSSPTTACRSSLTLDPDTDSQPLALAICVETGGAGARHLMDYRQLDALLDALIGRSSTVSLSLGSTVRRICCSLLRPTRPMLRSN